MQKSESSRKVFLAMLRGESVLSRWKSDMERMRGEAGVHLYRFRAGLAFILGGFASDRVREIPGSILASKVEATGQRSAGIGIHDLAIQFEVTLSRPGRPFRF